MLGGHPLEHLDVICGLVVTEQDNVVQVRRRVFVGHLHHFRTRRRVSRPYKLITGCTRGSIIGIVLSLNGFRISHAPIEVV